MAAISSVCFPDIHYLNAVELALYLAHVLKLTAREMVNHLALVSTH